MKTLLLLLCTWLCGVAALHAQAPTKIFVASFGSDANDGSRGAPKRNFQPAHDAVASGGQIVVLDTAGYGALAITKSLAITVPPGVNGFITATGTNNGIIIAGSAANVSLRGLIIEGGGASSDTPTYGIQQTVAGTLFLEDCTVRNFVYGLYLNAPSALRTYLRRCTVLDCGAGCVGFVSNGVWNCVALDCRFLNNLSFGFASDDAVSVVLERCWFSGNGYVNDGSAVSASGIFTQDPRLRVSNCAIVSNKGAVSGFVYTRGNNTVQNNPTETTFNGSFSAK